MSVLQAIAEVSTARLLNSVAEGLVVAAIAWILLRVLGRQNSGTRFAIWFSTLVVIAALPFAGLTSHAAAGGRPEIALSSSWAAYIFFPWAFLAVLAVTRVAIGLWRVRQLRACCIPLQSDNELTTEGRETHTGESVTTKDTKVFTKDTKEHWTFFRPIGHRNIRVCVSHRVNVPTAVGFFRPMVLLPEWAVRELSEKELHAVVLHEMAHLRRWDDWSNLAQKIIRAVFFFHPAVWWIDNRLTLEREMACDDLVLAETADHRSYAECLVSVAEKNLFRRGLAMAQAAVGRVTHMSLRLARILDDRRPRATRVWKPAMGLLGVVSAAGFIVAAHTSPLIGFTNSSPTVVAADSSIHLPAAMVVPAALHSVPTREQYGTVKPVKAKARSKAFRIGPMMARAATTKPTPVAAKVPQTKLPTYLVVETNYYQNSQGVFWTMTVWQVQAGSVREKQAVKQIDPRSI